MQAGMMREGWKKYQKSDATDRDVARHICFTHDYMYHVLDKSTLPGGRAIWINDLKGALMELSSLISGFHSCLLCMCIPMCTGFLPDRGAISLHSGGSWAYPRDACNASAEVIYSVQGWA